MFCFVSKKCKHLAWSLEVPCWWQYLKGEVLMVYFDVFRDIFGMMSILTKASRDWIHMEIIQAGFCRRRSFRYVTLLSLLFLLDKHHKNSDLQRKNNVYNMQLRPTMGSAVDFIVLYSIVFIICCLYCFLGLYYFWREMSIQSKAFCCIICDLSN